MTFKLSHIAASKSSFQGIEKPASNGMYIELQNPSLKDLLHLIKKVGNNSNWGKRKVYHDPTYLKDLKECIEQTSSHLWLFKQGKKRLGFAKH